MYWLLKIAGGQNMKEKTLYYRILVKVEEIMANYGFITVRISNGQLVSLDGVLTFDYLHGNIMDNGICLEYYSGDQNYQLSEEWSFFIKESDFELPINLIANFSDDVSVCIETLKEIKDLSEKKKCDETLQRYENVFN